MVGGFDFLKGGRVRVAVEDEKKGDDGLKQER